MVPPPALEPNQNPMRWLIAEDALRDRKGHWFDYLTTFRNGLIEVGDRVEILVDRQATPDVNRRLNANPILPKSIWSRMSDGAGPLTRFARVPLHALATKRAVADWFRHNASPDVVFVPTVLVHHLLGWTWLLNGLLRHSSARVILFFPNTPIRLSSANGSPEWNRAPTAILFRRLVHSLRTLVVAGKVVLGTETLPMRDALTRLTGVPFTYLPHPVASSPEAGRPATSPDESGLVMGSFGSARLEKGSDLLAAAVLDYCRRHLDSRVRFALQCVEGREKDWRPLQAQSRINLIQDYFAEGEYARQLHSTQILLLPYRRASYDLRVSRMVIEALIAGMPVVATRGTTLACQAEEFGAIVHCEDGDAPSLYEAICKAETSYPELHTRAAERSHLARQHFSVRNFRELFLATALASTGNH